MGYGVDWDIDNLLNLMGLDFTRNEKGLLTLKDKEAQQDMEATAFAVLLNTGLDGATGALLTAAQMAQRRGILDCNKPEEVMTPYGCWALYWALDRAGEPGYLDAMGVEYDMAEDGYPRLRKSYPEVKAPIRY